MLKCLFLVALLPLPTWEYKIKVEGKLDIGNQVADFLKELRSRIMEQRVRALREGQKMSETALVSGDDSAQTGKAKKTEKKEETLFEEMINKGKQKIHIYGSHNTSEVKNDRNNVHV